MLLAVDDLKRPPRPLVSRPSEQTNPAISPDGRWFVYQSNDSGQWEIYLSPFPDGDRARWQVSPAGGYNPAWSRRGQLFYLAYPYETGPVTSVTVLATGSVPVLGKPQPLFGFARRDYIYDVSPDGSRFLMTKQADTHEKRTLTVVTNWFEDLQARVR